ncbi:MAG: hypothetical protein FJY82_10380 [Candidatus Aminicenantes bacterium]|nr:hypothetical protein [Candidatus Aminicenantes bacterium]
MPNPEEEAVLRLVEAKGPRTGLEVKREVDIDPALLWRTCQASPGLLVRALGKRYLRLDRRVDGFARLSPSILREFYSYAVVGPAGDPGLVERRSAEVLDGIRKISRRKFELARRMTAEITAEFADEADRSPRPCFIIAGDIVYGMAHDVPRPERSTGKLVRGSDIDLVVVVDDGLPEALVRRLDEIVHRKKYRMLIDPAVNEEIDYKIKRLGRIREQARFDDFKSMVAVKILHEGLLLDGSRELFEAVKAILRENGLPARLEELEKSAAVSRENAEEMLRTGRLDDETIKATSLFYSAEEFEEFE